MVMKINGAWRSHGGSIRPGLIYLEKRGNPVNLFKNLCFDDDACNDVVLIQFISGDMNPDMRDDIEHEYRLNVKHRVEYADGPAAGIKEFDISIGSILSCAMHPQIWSVVYRKTANDSPDFKTAFDSLRNHICIQLRSYDELNKYALITPFRYKIIIPYCEYYGIPYSKFRDIIFSVFGDDASVAIVCVLEDKRHRRIRW